MGIWDLSKKELDEFVHHTRGDYSERLPPPASRWDNIPVYLDMARYFFSVILLLFLYTWLFCLWLDVILFLGT